MVKESKEEVTKVLKSVTSKVEGTVDKRQEGKAKFP
jgi:hypothetical protein